MGYSDIYEALVEPKTCLTCEFNFKGHGEKRGKRICAGGDKSASHEYGHIITDESDTCNGWGASYDAWTDAYNRAKQTEKR